MFCVENENITITKGDYGSINLKFKNADGSEYVPQDTDTVIFSAKKRKDAFCKTVLEKCGTTIVFESHETEKIPSGEYFYDVCILKATGERFTAAEGKFIVRKAVHNFE